MDVTICARILWATTAGLGAGTGNADIVTEARTGLGRLLWVGATSGFPPPVDPTPRQRESKAWSECVNAALAAQTSTSNPPKYALLWAGDPAATPPTRPAAGHSLHWPDAPGTSLERVIGPMQDNTGREIWLFLYKAIDTKEALARDGDAAPGLFPRATRAGAAAPTTVSPQAAPALRRSGAWAWVLLVASILLSALALLWVYAAAEFTRGAVAEIRQGTAITGEPLRSGGRPAVAPIRNSDSGWAIDEARAVSTEACADALEERIAGAAAPDVGLEPGADLDVCNEVWQIAWANQAYAIDSGDDWWAKTLAWFWQPTDLRGELSLLWPFLTAMLAILLLILGAGIAIKNYFLGALIDERNRISLSRLQQLCWTVVLLGGFAVLGIFNVALLAGYVRNLAQAEAFQSTMRQDETVAEFWGFFPYLDPVLWAVLGITVVLSPYLSKRILANKERGAAAATGETVDWQGVEARAITTERLDRREAPAEAGWADLFTGEGEANADRVDVSRLQHLVITGLLLGGYLILLIEYVRTLDGTTILLAMQSGAPVFAAMPPVDATFVGLLALSHAGYLAFKALPATSSGEVK